MQKKSGTGIYMTLVGMIVLAVLVGYGAQSQAANYPVKPITFVVPYAAGGSSDLSARPLADELSNILNQPVVVMNKPGAGGAIGAADVLRGRHDGYTLLNGSIGPLGIVPHTSNVGYDYTSFRAVAQLTDTPVTIAVRADSPITNLKEFVEYAKANPGKIRYGTPGAGNIQHMRTVGWAKEIGIDIVHMPYEGANPAVAALLGGHVESAVTSATEVTLHAKSGALRILGIMAPNRIDLVDAPTFREQGYDVLAGVWYGIVVPKSTPDDVVKTLAEALKNAYAGPKVQDAWAKLLLAPAYLGPEELDARIARESDTYKQILKDLGLYKK